MWSGRGAWPEDRGGVIEGYVDVCGSTCLTFGVEPSILTPYTTDNITGIKSKVSA